MIRDKDIEIEDNYDLVRISKWFQVKKKKILNLNILTIIQFTSDLI